MAVAHFTQQMALEHAKEAEKDRQRRLTAELERFMGHCLGVRAKQAAGAIKRHQTVDSAPSCPSERRWAAAGENERRLQEELQRFMRGCLG